MTIRLVPRDLGLMKWINSFGYVTIEQIARWMQVSKGTAYIRVRKLVDRRLIIHERIFQHQPGIYRLSREGASSCHSSLPALKKVSLSTILHNLKVVDVSLCLQGRYRATFISERELRQQSGQPSIGYQGHHSDGLLVLPDKKIAIEVEMTQKAKARLNKIIECHCKNTSVDEIWYLCADTYIQRVVNSYAEKIDFIHVYLLDEFLQRMNNDDQEKQ